MKAIILAAGRSSRLYPLTLEKPKCLIDVGGKKMIDRQIEQLRSLGVEDIVVVVGYLKDVIKSEVGDKVRYLEFDDFAKGNNILTLNHIRDELNDDTLLLFSDVILETSLLKQLIEDKNDFTLLVHTKEVLAGTMRVRVEAKGIVDIGSHIPVEEGYGNFIGIAKYSKRGAELVKQEIEKAVNTGTHNDDYYTIVLKTLASMGEYVHPLHVEEKYWIEIDTKEDLDKARATISSLQ